MNIYEEIITTFLAYLVILPWCTCCILMFIILTPVWIMLFILMFVIFSACSIITKEDYTKSVKDIFLWFLFFPLLGVPKVNDFIYNKFM